MIETRKSIYEKKYTKAQLIEKVIELEDDYENLESENENLQDELDLISEEISDTHIADNSTMILDINLFKEKLELYDLKSDKLFDFIDLYMKLYNKE